MKKIASGVVVLVTLLALVACGGGGGNKVYKLKTIETMGVSMDVSQFSELSGMDLSAVQIEMKGDGTFTMSAPDFSTGKVQSETGTWKEVDGGYQLTGSDGTSIDAELRSGGKQLVLSMSDSGVTVDMIFES